MNISKNGIASIIGREGEKLKAYLDSVGIPTIGVGHTGPEVQLGVTITKDQSAQLLADDLKRFEAAVNTGVKVPLSQDQFDALVSFSFNVGVAAFKGSTLLKLLNSGDYEGAAAQFMVWTKQKELTSRRQSEMDQFRGKR